MKRPIKLLYVLPVLALLTSLLSATSACAPETDRLPSATTPASGPAPTTTPSTGNPPTSTTSLPKPTTTVAPPSSPTIPASGDTTKPDFSDPALDYFTIVAIPDTQIYSKSYPAIFNGITGWITANRFTQNIAFTVHEGDLVDDSQDMNQSENARAAMGILRAEGVPYTVLSGNHDTQTGASNYNTFFPFTDFMGNGTYGGHYPSNGNQSNYNLFSVRGLDFIVISVGSPPVDAGLYKWVDGLLTAYSGRRALIVTHGYINQDGSLIQGWGTDLYAVIGGHDNVFAVLCGHWWGAAHAVQTGLHGNRIDALLFDMQHLPNGGDGDIRLYRFFPTQNRIEVHTLSTLRSQELTDPNNRFDIPYVQSGPTKQ